MADFWWNPEQDFEEKEDIIGGGFEQPKETPYTSLSSDTPDDVEAIPFQVGDSRMPSQYGMRKTDSGVEFWNRERGERLEGEEAQFAQQLLEDSALPDRVPSEPAADTVEQPTPDQVAGEQRRAGDAVRENAARRREEMVASDVSGVSFASDGRAVIETPDDVETIGGAMGALPRNINANTARDLTPESARRIFERTFNKPVPSEMSPQEALAEELRNMRR